MRTTVLLVLCAACDKGGSSPIDAGASDSLVLVDARTIDAPTDAPLDAYWSPEIVATCMHACDALGVCFMMPPDDQCYAGCSADLTDCTAEQVQAVESCTTAACGDQTSSPITDCLMMITCIMP